MKSPSLLLLLPVLASTVPAAPITIGPGVSTYTQNFDGLANGNGTNNVLASPAWSDNTTIPGWVLFRAGQAAVPTGLAGNAFPYGVSDGSVAPNTAPMTHGFFSIGAANSPERALGASPTSALGEMSSIVLFGNANSNAVRLTNIKFNVEAYRDNSTASNNDSLFMWYRIVPTEAAANTFTTAPATAALFPPAVSTGLTAQYYLSGWTALDTYRHTESSPTIVQIDPVKVIPFNAAPPSPIYVPPGQFLQVRWSNLNDAGADTLQGIDDLELSFNELNLNATVSNITRESGAVLTDPSDDTISFDLTVTGSAAPAGWVISASSPVAPGTAGAYGAPVHLTRPVSEFVAGAGTANIPVEDVTSPLSTGVGVASVPKFVQVVTPAFSPGITFTPSTAGALSYANPFNTFTDLGWSTTGTTSFVEVQPLANTSGNKYFVHTNQPANAVTMTSDPVSLSQIGGQAVELEAGVAVYTTSNSGVEDTDIISVNLEVALDGNFANATPGNLLTDVVTGVDTINPPLGAAWGAAIPATTAVSYINIVAPFPAADFTFHKFKKSIPVPAPSAATAMARLVYTATTGITTEHILLDDVVFRAVVSDSLNVTTPTGFIRNANGPGAADDTVTFTVDITGLGISPQWNATGATPASGAYGPAITLTVPAPTNVNLASVTITDSVNLALTKTFVVRFDPIYLIGTTDLGGGPQDLFSAPVDTLGQGWKNTPATKITELNNAGNTNAKTFTSGTVNLTGIDNAMVSLTLALKDQSNGFEAGDRFELHAILNGNAASPVNLVTDNQAGSYDDGAPIGVAPNGLATVANDGILSGGELVPAGNPAYTAATPFTRDLTFRYTFPPGTTTAAIVFTGTNESTNEFVAIKDLLFSISTFADADHDGMEDAYEDAYGLDKNNPGDKLTDLDGDGQSNYAEYLAGTAANDDTAFLHVYDGTLDTATGIGSTSWTSVAGKRYRIQLSGDLSAWTDAGATITATGTTTTANYTIPGAPLTGKGFLRVKVVP